MAADQHRRGGGPLMGNLSGGFGGAFSGTNYSFDTGIAVGNLWFDSDTNNDGSTDNATTLDANWHFDHTTAVAGGKNDFYSVALHEVLHSIGYGSSDTWDSLNDNGDWLGAEGIAANGGTGIGLIDEGGGHIQDNVQSFRISDGLLQDAIMTPSITTGQRKMLTELDLAILRDLGYTTVTAVPEPSTFAMLFVGCLVGCSRRRRQAS